MPNKIMIMQDNVITQSRYDFSVVEKRCLYLVIKEVRDILDGKRSPELLNNNLTVWMDYSKLSQAGNKSNKIYESLRALRHRDIEIKTPQFWLNVGFINKAKHHIDGAYAGKVEVEISNEIVPYFVNLAERYTAYDLLLVITLKKQSSQRLYEHCAQFRVTGWFDITVEMLKKQLCVENKYSMYAAFKSRVLESARIELKELYDKGQCDLYFEYTEQKVGRSVKSLKFNVITRGDQERKGKEKLSTTDMIWEITRWLNLWLKSDQRPKNKEWVSKVVKFLNLHAEEIEDCYNKLVRIQTKYNFEDLGAMARHVITEDFLPEEN